MTGSNGRITVALSGNPNSGKTTVFNALTGARQHIANYPGVTVEKKVGRVSHRGYEIEVVDLPGTYSLSAYSLEEIVARDFLINERPDLVIDIVDASNLDRNLYLAVQFKELGIPMILALNMVDVAESRDIHVDEKVLSGLLDVPVVPMTARSGKGVSALLDEVVRLAQEHREWRPAVISYGLDIDQSIAKIEDLINSSEIYDRKYPARWRALKCMEGDSRIFDLLKRDPEVGDRIVELCGNTSRHIMNTLDEDPEGIIADYRYGYIAGITKKAVKRKIELRLNLSDKIDRVLTNRVVGPVFMIAVLYVIYAFTFWASEVPLRWFELFFDGLRWAASQVLPPGAFQSLIISGLIDGVGGVLGFVPLIMFMFFAISIMEDSGYMARIAYMLDRVLRWFGLHGNSVMALIVSGGISGGCAVPGVMAARTLRNPKERIATLLAVPFMNCGAKLPVYAMLIGAFFARNQARMMLILTLLSWGFALFAAKLIRSTVLRGPKTPFVMELPPYRFPTMKGLLIHTWERTWQYIKKAGTVILGFSVILWVIMTFPGLSEEEKRSFHAEVAEMEAGFLALPEAGEWVKNSDGLHELYSMHASYEEALKEGTSPPDELERDPLYPFIQEIHDLETDGGSRDRDRDRDIRKAAAAYIKLRENLRKMALRQQQASLEHTAAGWIGRALETVTEPLGFDYRINIALLGGFAAKEVVISTLGTAYSLGDIDPGGEGSLSRRLKESEDWNPLLAFTLIVFTMLYVPCFVTVISIRKESSWRWALFSVGFNLAAAYLVALVIMKGGTFLGIGV